MIFFYHLSFKFLFFLDFLRHNWQNCTYLKCITCKLDICIHCEIFTTLKASHFYVHETHRSPCRFNQNKIPLRESIRKLSKNQVKFWPCQGKKRNQNKQLHFIEWSAHKAISGVYSRNLADYEKRRWYSQSFEREREEKTCQPRMLYLAKLSSSNEREIDFPRQ